MAKYILYFACLIHALGVHVFINGARKDNNIHCSCNNHSIYCSTTIERTCTGCQHNTHGPYCDFCLPGFYGNATTGKSDSCKKCPCDTTRSNGSCIVEPSGSISCLKCLDGYTGQTCNVCALNYYFDKSTHSCLPCKCPGITQLPQNQMCNPTNGACFACVNHRTGKFCEKCEDGYSLSNDREGGGCKECYCHGNEDHKIKPICDWRTGTCFSCTKNTSGKHCENCALGYLGDAVSGKNCTKKVEEANKVPSNKELVLVLSVTLVSLISMLGFLVCFCWWRRRTLRSRARFVSVEIRGTSVSSSYDIGLIDPVTGEPVPDLDCEQEVDTIKMTNGNLQIESPYDIDVSDTDRML